MLKVLYDFGSDGRQRVLFCYDQLHDAHTRVCYFILVFVLILCGTLYNYIAVHLNRYFQEIRNCFISSQKRIGWHYSLIG